jgi:hypothetical protein
MRIGGCLRCTKWNSQCSVSVLNLVPRACDPREGTWGSGIIRCRKPGILAKIKLRIPYQRPIRFLPETDYPRASRSFPRIAGSGNEIVSVLYFKSVPILVPKASRACATFIGPGIHGIGNARKLAVVSKAHALELGRFSTRDNFNREVLRRNEVFVLTYFDRIILLSENCSTSGK